MTFRSRGLRQVLVAFSITAERPASPAALSVASVFDVEIEIAVS
jgi:hypothetical protein